MECQESAILRTVLYADVFDFPLTLEELHRYLIDDTPHSIETIKTLIATSSRLQACLHITDTYICLKNRTELIDIRQARETITQSVWQNAIKYGRWLSYIPFVRMVALTGALSVRNPSSRDDDYDYLLVTQPKRVWLARAFAIAMVRVVRLFGHEICPNYVLASDQLIQSRQDLYMAHEVSQMQPIYGDDLYHAIFDQNDWIYHYLPNVTCYPTEKDKAHQLQGLFEWVLNGQLGDLLENWEYQRKSAKFRPKISQPQSSAEIDKSNVKGHFEDHGQPVLRRYQQLLYEYDLLETHHAMAGD